MSKHGLNKLSAIMAHSAEQLKQIEEELLYMSAVKAFYPTEDEKKELSDERIAAMDVIIKYQTDLTKRLEKAKVEAQRQFDWAKEEYLNLIEQLQQCQQDTPTEEE